MNKALKYACALSVAGLMAGVAQADTIKVGVIGTMSGPYALFGQNFKAGIEAWVAEHGSKVAGHDVEFIYRDEESPNPAKSKALAQELIVKDKVQYIAGLYFTPDAMAVAPLLEEAKTPMIVFNAATSSIVERALYRPNVVHDVAEHCSRRQGGEGKGRQESGDRCQRLWSGHRCRSGFQENVRGGRRHGC
jgi:branched-chain amino acid transport system substrate-binding protein